MIQFSNIPSDCKSLFTVLAKEEQISGFIYNVDFSSEDEALSYLLTIIDDFENHIKENTQQHFLLMYPGFNFWVKVIAYPQQNKFVFLRVFNYH